MSYIRKVLSGELDKIAIGDYIVAWHKSDEDIELHEYLGLTWAEYRFYAQSPKNLDEVINMARERIKLANLQEDLRFF